MNTTPFIQTAPNQKVVTVHKAPCSDTQLYSKTNIEVESAAMRDLGGSSFMLWRYLSWNKDGRYFALSSSDVYARTGIAVSTFPRCVKELISKGYLVQTKEGSNHYYFNEVPVTTF